MNWGGGLNPQPPDNSNPDFIHVGLSVGVEASNLPVPKDLGFQVYYHRPASAPVLVFWVTMQLYERHHSIMSHSQTPSIFRLAIDLL